MVRTPLLLLIVLLVNSQARAVVWRADLKAPPTKQTANWKHVGRLHYTRLELFGGTCVWIGDRWALTARHGVDDWKPSSLVVDFPAAEEQRFNVKSIHLPKDTKVDLALIELSDVPKLKQPLPLLRKALVAGQRVTFGGYGLFGPAGTKQGLNRFHWGENELDSADTKLARFSLSKPPQGLAGEATVALMDSGSPVFAELQGKPHLAGIIVRATGAAGPNYGDRATFTCLYEHLEWIKEVTGE